MAGPWDILYNGLTVSLTGVLTVFLVLAILAIIIWLFPYITSLSRARPRLEARTSVSRETIVKPGIPKDVLSVIVSAVTGFLEFKKCVLEEVEYYRIVPGIQRVLSLAGVRFRGRLKVSIGGSERDVVVEETSSGEYRVEVHGRVYRVRLSLPIGKRFSKTIDLLELLESKT